MRDAIQVELSVPEFHDAKRVERQRHLAQLLAILGRSHDEDWYRWTLCHARQEHLHGSRRKDGSPAACPVHGCTILQGQVAA